MSNGNGQNMIDKILADAKAEAKIITDAATREAEAVLEAAKAKAQKESQALSELAQAEADKAAAKQISSAEMLAKKMILTQKQSTMEEVIEAAKAKLLSLTDVEYKVIIIGMLDKAEIDKDSEIIFSKKDKDSFGKEVASNGYKVSEETRDINGGFIVKKGDIEYNYSFESIISVEKEDIEQIAAGILFG
ncbi:MAG: V-type ATP synthase subunit E [Lachnospiraceae bacterium]|nr:V-type ATP synthase subunit E [Lachnospiraceae bacterium]